MQTVWQQKQQREKGSLGNERCELLAEVSPAAQAEEVSAY